MSKNKKPRKAYRPRAVAVNTMDLALHRAAKPAQADLAQVLAGLQRAVQALRTGCATQHDWCVAAGSASVAQAIERQGVVRGLREHLASAGAVLQAIHERCARPSMWLRPTLSGAESEALQLLVELHAFQMQQLGRAEFLRAIDAAEKDTIANGGTVTLVRDIERMAA